MQKSDDETQKGGASESQVAGKNQHQDSQRAESDSPQTAAIDLEGLDLTVEVVDERISPSETNVFDK